MKYTVHILCSGRVQGVSFRAFTQKLALQLGIVGWVRNLDDGRVEAVLQGQRDRMNELIERLKIGPARAEVGEVQCREVSRQTEFENFLIEEDGDAPWSSN